MTLPFMDRSVPSTQTKPGRFPILSGVDGRFVGCLRKFYGMTVVKNLSDVVAMTNVGFIKHAIIYKVVTSVAYTLNGFVVRWGADSANRLVNFIWWDEALDSWSHIAVWSGTTGITDSTLIDVSYYDKYLYVCVSGKAMKTIYHNGTDVVVKDAGPGQFHDNHSDGTHMAALISNSGGDTTSGGHLKGGGEYKIAYRFYDSTRKIYSAMSPMITRRITGASTELECLGGYKLPAQNTPSWFVHTSSGAGFGEVFDTLEIFRSINVGENSGLGAAKLYRETSLAIPASGSWNGATARTFGSQRDDVLTTLTQYDPFMDVVTEVPQGGAMGFYGGCMFAGDSPANLKGIRTRFSNPYKESVEYYTTAGYWRGDPTDGAPMRYVCAGENMYVTTKNSLTLVRKKGAVIRFIRLHIGRGAVSQGAIHSVGNVILMCSPLGIAAVDAQESNMIVAKAFDGLIDEWIASIDAVDSCFDGKMGASFFLNPTEKETAVMWHTTSAPTMLEGTNFAACTHGLPPDGLDTYVRAMFVTSGGLVVMPDVARTGSGTMRGISSSYTLNGTTTSAGTGHIIDSGGSFHSSMVGSMVYLASGTAAGTWLSVSAVASGDLTLDQTSQAIPAGTRYVISPVVFRVRAWPLQPPEVGKEQEEGVGGTMGAFQRKILTSLAVAVGSISGFTANVNRYWRLGAYRNGSSSLAVSDTTLAIDENTADSVVYMNVDGVDIEPYIEQAAAGVDFKLTAAEAGITISYSRKVSD